eukprot:4137737-Prymnesium_polylepis.1
MLRLRELLRLPGACSVPRRLEWPNPAVSQPFRDRFGRNRRETTVRVGKMIFTPTYCTRDMRSTQALLMGNRCRNFIHSFVIAQYGCVGDGKASPHHGTSDGHHYLHRWATLPFWLRALLRASRQRALLGALPAPAPSSASSWVQAQQAQAEG